MGFSSLILKELENGKYNSDTDLRRKAHAIYRGAETLHTLISNLLELSKMDSKKVDLNINQFEVATFMRDISNFQLFAAEEKNIFLENHYLSDVPDIIMTDREILFHILCTIISCMIKNSSIDETVSFGCKSSGDSIIFWIKGSNKVKGGPSLAEIFNKYTEKSSQEIPSFSGTTLMNLTIARANSALLGAHLTATEEEDKACIFELAFTREDILPKEGVYQAESVHSASNVSAKTEHMTSLTEIRAGGEPEQQMPAKKYSILMAEDNESNRFLIELMLRDSEFDLECVPDGIACLDVLSRKKFDILILDLQMPTMDGYTVMDKIRKSENLKDIPIVIITAYLEEKGKAKLLKSGADDCLLKPLNIETVLRSLRKISDKIDARVHH